MTDIQGAILEQALQFYETGRDSYTASRIGAAVERLNRARRLAAGVELTRLETTARFWEGAALHGMGRLREALAVWAPALSGSVGGPLDSDRYMMLTRYVLVAIDMPLRLSVIEKALDEVAERLGVSGFGPGPRSRLLVARSRLAATRGHHDEALALAQEALQRRKLEAFTYSYTTYYRTLARQGLYTGQPDLVARYLEAWDRLERDFPESKRLALTAARANLARYQGRWDDALGIAEQVAREAAWSDEIGYSFEALRAYVRACLAAGRPERARLSLARFLRIRHSEASEFRFEVHLLLGDYHACNTCITLFGRGFDPEFQTAAVPGDAPGTPRSPPPGAAMPCSPALPPTGATKPLVARQTERARRAYRRADREGCRLDDLLVTNHYRMLVENRIRLLEELNRAT